MIRDCYDRILDGLDDETIARYDREESGVQCSGTDEAGQWGGAFTFGALPRERQAAILSALGENLPTRTKRPNANAGTSYALKHVVERFAGFYVSNLQTKVAMRILGYERGGGGLNPVYNISARECRAFAELSRDMDVRRYEAQRRMSRRSAERKAAGYFAKLHRTP